MRFERSFSARNAENPQDDVFAKLFGMFSSISGFEFKAITFVESYDHPKKSLLAPPQGKSNQGNLCEMKDHIVF